MAVPWHGPPALQLHFRSVDNAPNLAFCLRLDGHPLSAPARGRRRRSPPYFHRHSLVLPRVRKPYPKEEQARSPGGRER